MLTPIRTLVALTVVLQLGCADEQAPRSRAEAGAGGGAPRFEAAGQAFRATHPRLGMATTLDDRGARIRTGGGQDCTLSLAGVDRARAPVPGPSRVTPVLDAGRAQYARAGAVVEWYRSMDRGIEQGFDLPARPAGTGVLEISVEVTGDLVPVLVGTEVELQDAAGLPRLVYSEVHAIDDSSRELSAALTVRGRRIVLLVDDADARYPVRVDPIVTTELGEVHASDGATTDRLGGTPFASAGGPAVAVAEGGAVAASSFANAGAGAAYVYVPSGPTVVQEARIGPPAGLPAASRFGYSVAISGESIIIGAPMPASSVGYALVFTRTSPGVWSLEDTLTAPGGLAGENFGVAVDIDGDTAIVGARYDDRAPTAGGAAYVYTRSAGVWTFEARLKASDSTAGDDFGTQVAVSGDTAAVGAIFHPAATPTGAVYVFTRAAGVWTERTQLFASDAALNDQFSRSLDLVGGDLIAGAPLNQVTAAGQGAAYVFTGAGATWTEQARLLPLDPGANDQFGFGVAVAPGMAIVGSRYDDDLGVNSGSAYFFQRAAGIWTQEAKHTASDGAAGDRFGDSVGLAPSAAIIGAPYTDDLGANAGSAYVLLLDVTQPNGEPCSGASTCASGFCVDGVCCATGCGAGALDCRACSVAAGGSVDGTCTTIRSGFTITCRASAGVCDVAEACLSTSTACPADTFLSGTLCRAAAGDCDVDELCTGSSAACPSDVLSAMGTVCRAVAGDCDVAETCSGSNAQCPANGYSPPGTVCRAVTGDCDVAETCPGGTAACPADTVLPAATLCRASAGICDVAEVCNGTSGACPANAFSPSGTACRASSGDCDPAENCTGASAACPVDALAASGTPCRAASGDCDIAETCSGADPYCPTDGLAPAGSVCRAAAGDCDVQEICSGLSRACPADVLLVAGAVCRVVAGACDVAESCSGTSAACPTDAFLPAATGCRASAGDCDPAESCTGSAAACPADALTASGTECRASAGDCDPAESCSGTTPACPTDALTATGTTCRAAAHTCDVEETCTGTSTDCPSDALAADGTDCGDGLACNGAEACASGSCAAGTPVDCDDSDPCTADACAEPATCTHIAVTGCCLVDGDCDDGDACTSDTCNVGTHACSHLAIPGCGIDGGLDAGPDEDGGLPGDSGPLDDAGPIPDAGPLADAGPDLDAATPSDGSVAADASPDSGTTTPVDDGGCCAVAPGRRSPHDRAGWVLLALGVAWLGRRRRGRRRSR